MPEERTFICSMEDCRNRDRDGDNPCTWCNIQESMVMIGPDNWKKIAYCVNYEEYRWN